MALILMDYCNETILKAIHYYLLCCEEDNLWTCWKNIDKELKAKKSVSGLSELPYKHEILNIIHKKRNFVQHSGESPRNEEAIRYLAYTRLFIEVVSKEILGEDFGAITPASIIKNRSYRMLIEKAVENKDKDPKLAGAFLTCALSFADGVMRSRRSGAGDHLGWKISHLLERSVSNEFEKVFTDIGNRIETNTKIIEGLIRDGCNPPREVLQKLPSGYLTDAQTFGYTCHGYEVTPDEIKQAMVFVVRYIVKLEKLGLLLDIHLDLEKGIKIE